MKAFLLGILGWITCTIVLCVIMWHAASKTPVDKE